MIRSSLSDGQDFFTYEPSEPWDMLVSNPPFSKKDDVLARAFSFNKPFALLLPVNSLQGKKRFSIFNNQIQMLSFDLRVDYHTNSNFETYTKGNHFGSAYFCRNLLVDNNKQPSKLELRNLHKYDRKLKDNPEIITRNLTVNKQMDEVMSEFNSYFIDQLNNFSKSVKEE